MSVVATGTTTPIGAPRPIIRSHAAFATLLCGLFMVARPSPAVMDIADHGPTLNAGRFAMRVTNIGVLGNAFFDKGLSFDPSFEYPRGSGHELLNHAELWVGGRHESGPTRVSGGPMLEWRPTLDAADTVRVRNAGDPGTRAHVDDDGDGRIDEEVLNGIDDDGDGRVDEDISFPAQQTLTADYTDDRPEAVSYAYPTGEQHVPLGLSVHQECYAWVLPGHEGIAGISFTITHHGQEALRDVRLGLYADLDVRERNDPAGHLDDAVGIVPYSVILAPHADTLVQGAAVGGLPLWVKPCGERIEGQAAVVRDAGPASTRPAVALIGLSHTTDPLGWLVNDAFPGVREARASARAPRRDTTFRFSVFASDAPPRQGGPPITDEDRYAALAGTYPTARTDRPADYAVLISCGPFSRLDPGQSVAFAVAIAGLPTPDSAASAAFEARMLYRGTRLDLQPNDPHRGVDGAYRFGETGINGHEICLEPPPGIQFNYDPHCPQKFGFDPDLIPVTPATNPGTVATEVTYKSGQCIWTDLDCDVCTGDDGVDEVRHWELDMRLPPSPTVRATPGDHRATIAWDNRPELAIASGIVGGPDFHFAGYKLYRLDDWRRSSELPEPERWQRLGVYRVNPGEGGLDLADITDASLEPDGSDAGGPHYPVGRYRVTDARALDGFDYHYVVTTILRQDSHPGSPLAPREYESPFFASFDDRVVPHAAARAAAGQVWVVPNPYRSRAPWERQSVPGDVFTRHIDFMGLPRAHCRIRVYTLAGDLVQTLDHDGSGGDGEAPWNLISRNGQDVESGVYLFTVDSPLGHQIGKFVLMR